MTSYTGKSFMGSGVRAIRTAALTMLAFVGLAIAPGAADAAKRVALVIGNSAYQNASVLANPANDASDMATSLRTLGFTVVDGRDLDHRAMRDKVREFSNELRGADVGMLFYAGHAIQVNGTNYLAPVDTRLEYETDIDFETISLDFIQAQMEREVKTILIFLDACRDNPLTRSFKTAARSTGAGQGLAEAKLSAAGTFIAFATNPGNVALDGKGRNSPFTKALLANIQRPGVEISTLMTDVRLAVVQETDGAQTPWINSSLLGHFYFAQAAQQASVPAQQTASLDKADVAQEARPAQSSLPSELSTAQIEKLAWEAVKDTPHPEELEAFMAIYGSSFYGELARIRLARLNEERKAAANAAQAKQETVQVQQQEPAKPAEPAQEQQVASLDTSKEEAAEATRKIEPQVDMRQVTLDIQQELARFNCNPGRPDGIWGRRSSGALNALAKNARIRLVSADPSVELLEQLREHDGKGCFVPERKVVKTCPAGQKLSSKGNCYTPRQSASVQQQPVTRSAAPQEEIIIDEQPRQVIVQQPQRVIVQQLPQQVIVQPQPQPQPRPGLTIGGAIGGGVVSCILLGC
jgi:hypothetical protein